MTLKKSIIGVALYSMVAMFAGCDKLPSVEKMTTISTIAGKTAGYVCELSKTKTEVKEAIAKVLDIASNVVPTTGQTFVEAWAPVIETELKKLVDEGKIDATGSQVASIALKVACEGVDYIFIKYPKAKDAKELVGAAVAGFVNGYKSVVACDNCTDCTIRAGSSNPDIDEEAYKYLKSKMDAYKK